VPVGGECAGETHSSRRPQAPGQPAWQVPVPLAEQRHRRGHERPRTIVASMSMVAAGALPDGTLVIVSSDRNGTWWVWRLADGTPLAHPLDLAKPLRAIAIHGDIIVTAVGRDVAVHQPVPPCPPAPAGRHDQWIMASYPVHQAAMHRDDLGMGVRPYATRTRYPVHGSRKTGGEGTAPSQTPSTLQGAPINFGPGNPRWLAPLWASGHVPCTRSAT
jgi:hypothetical protein